MQRLKRDGSKLVSDNNNKMKRCALTRAGIIIAQKDTQKKH